MNLNDLKGSRDMAINLEGRTKYINEPKKNEENAGRIFGARWTAKFSVAKGRYKTTDHQ